MTDEVEMKRWRVVALVETEVFAEGKQEAMEVAQNKLENSTVNSAQLMDVAAITAYKLT